MARKLEITLLLGSFALFLGAFQNCATYQANEQSSVEGASPSAPRALGANKVDSPAGACAGWLSEGEADVIFEKPTALKDASEAAGYPACLISALESFATGAETAICSSSVENLALVAVDHEDQNLIFTDPASNGPMSGGSFGYASALSGGGAAFVFVGAEEGARQAVACRFAFESEADLRLALPLVSVRGSKLVRAISAKVAGRSPAPAPNSQ